MLVEFKSPYWAIIRLSKKIPDGVILSRYFVAYS